MTEWVRDIEERDPGLKPGPLAGITDPVVFKAIKDMQPFREGTAKARKNDALMHLLRMSNADKHRILHIGAVHTGRLEYLYFAPRGYVKILKRRSGGPGRRVESGAEVARVKVEWLRDPDRKIGVHFKALAQISFCEPGKVLVSTVNDLYRIVNRVVEVWADLERFVVPEVLWFRSLRVSLGADPFSIPITPPQRSDL
jgi:hypothetical protein